MPRVSQSVLFVGDINVDVLMLGLESLPQVDREITCRDLSVAMGSTAVISACTYAGLGGRAAFFGLAGRDDYGAFMRRGLRERGVDVSRVQTTDAVRTGVTVNLIYGQTRSQVTYPGTIAEFGADGVDPAVLDGVVHAHFAGPYLQTKFRPHLAGLLRAARQRGVTTSMDPQWDPAERWEHMAEWLPLLDLFFCNGGEAMSITRAATPEAACRALAERTRLPVVKVGEHGALLLDDAGVVAVPAYRVEVVDTTGAGDAFDAGFLYAIITRQAAGRAAAAFANAVAARCCMFAGGTAARTTVRDAERLVRAGIGKARTATRGSALERPRLAGRLRDRERVAYGGSAHVSLEPHPDAEPRRSPR